MRICNMDPDRFISKAIHAATFAIFVNTIVLLIAGFVTILFAMTFWWSAASFGMMAVICSLIAWDSLYFIVGSKKFLSRTWPNALSGAISLAWVFAALWVLRGLIETRGSDVGGFMILLSVNLVVLAANAASFAFRGLVLVSRQKNLLIRLQEGIRPRQNAGSRAKTT